MQKLDMKIKKIDFFRFWKIDTTENFGLSTVYMF